MATRLEEQLIAWHNEHYGVGVDIPATFRHLLEEVGELGEALLLNDYAKIWGEVGDVGILLYIVLHGVCLGDPACNPASLSVAMAMALEKCKERKTRRSPRRHDPARGL